MGKHRTLRDRIYFIQPIGGGPIKIGFSRFSQNRLNSVMSWSPYPLQILVEVPGDKTAEKAIHEKFHYCRSHGEWFRPTLELMSFIREVRAARSIPAGVWPEGWQPPPPTVYRSQFRALLKKHAIRPVDFARVINVTEMSMYNWSTSGVPEHRIDLVIKGFASFGVTVDAADLVKVTEQAA